MKCRGIEIVKTRVLKTYSSCVLPVLLPGICTSGNVNCFVEILTENSSIFYLLTMSSPRPGKAIRFDLVQQSIDLTEGLKELVQENNYLKERVHKLEQSVHDVTSVFGGQAYAQTSREIEQRHETDLTQMKERLQEKENEVESLKKRLAAMSERKVNQDQSRTENTSSSNRQSEVEKDYTHAFKDGTRVDVIDVIKKNSTKSSKPRMDHLKASRLACLIFEVSYECAMAMMENFTHRSSSLLDTLINRPPSIAFLDTKKPHHGELFSPISPSAKESVVVQDALREVMVLVKETAVKHDLEKLVQTTKNELQRKWKLQLNQQKASRSEPVLPTYIEKLRGLENYIECCCRFSWRIVTQVPPLKIDYLTQNFNPRSHVDHSATFSSDKKKASSEIKCYLWPTLLDCDSRVIAKGDVLLREFK